MSIAGDADRREGDSARPSGRAQPTRTEIAMSLPAVTSREQWLIARKELLAREKDFTRQRDALNTSRRELPMVRIDKDYVFEGPRGKVGLLDMFGSSRQLVVQHVMYDPAWDDACPSCTASLDELSGGLLAHLRARETAFSGVSRAPFAKIAAYKARRGWDFPWYSSYDSDFNYDFHVSLDASVTPIMFNYRDAAELKEAGMGWLLDGPSEQPGVSCFLRDGAAIFHTYSTFGRGTEQGGGAYAVLDMTALGRQEEWEEPKGRADAARNAIPDFAE
jgi:predicted dithiol-disulfide oxidoreductase (DUF899 family)